MPASTATPTGQSQTEKNEEPAATMRPGAKAPSTRTSRRPTRTPTSESPAAAIATPVAAAVGTVAAALPNTGIGSGKIPVFDHIVLIVFENHGFDSVIGNTQMPTFNALASKYVLLTQYHAVRHPSLPNYIALMSGDTFGITKDCTDCFLPQTNLADRIEASGRTWKTYQEDMPSPCFLGNAEPYFQKHNPFLYFDDIRTNSDRCNRSIVPLTQLDADLAANQLPNFSFIMPNICNSGHDCDGSMSDKWLAPMIAKLQSAPALQKNSLIIVTFDESEGQNDSCCGLPKSAGGRVATILISPEAKAGFQDATPYSHYSLLKTILGAWSLPDLGNTAMGETQPILEPWK